MINIFRYTNHLRAQRRATIDVVWVSGQNASQVCPSRRRAQGKYRNTLGSALRSMWKWLRKKGSGLPYWTCYPCGPDIDSRWNTGGRTGGQIDITQHFFIERTCYCYDRTGDSCENQCGDINGAGNIGRLLLTVAAELIEDELTERERRLLQMQVHLSPTWKICLSIYLGKVINIARNPDGTWNILCMRIWISTSALTVCTCWQPYLESATKGMIML